MSTTFEPKYVASDVVAKWPSMALSLWKRSFSHQAIILLAAAMFIQALPSWSTVAAFLIAPSLFIVSFAVAQLADERTKFAWSDLLDLVSPGVVRLGHVSFRFGMIFGTGIAVLAGISSLVTPAPDTTGLTPAVDTVINAPLMTGAATAQADNLAMEFFLFCAKWTEGVMTLVFLGLLIVVIYQGIFGAILHAQQGMDVRESRIYGWRAWQINTVSFEKALHQAPAKFWCYVLASLFVVICSFQTVYLSPIALVLATYIPCLVYVAYRSIFLGSHENVPASARVTANSTEGLATPVL